jgi:hypothetical protein
VFSLKPVLVNLTPHEYYVPSSEAELPDTHIHSIILPCLHYDTRLVSILISRTLLHNFTFMLPHTVIDFFSITNQTH